ncbi:hypothetical protein YC2023_069502 [Brassica napus]
MNTSVDHNSQAKGKKRGKKQRLMTKLVFVLLSSPSSVGRRKDMASEVLLKRRLQNLWRQTDVLPAKCKRIESLLGSHCSGVVVTMENQDMPSGSAILKPQRTLEKRRENQPWNNAGV